MNDIRHVMDALTIIQQEYCKILSINLTTYKFVELKSENCEDFDDIRKWIRKYVNESNMNESELELVRDIENIKEHFRVSNDKIAFRVRRKSNNISIWYSIQIYKGSDYTSTNESVMMFIRNIDDEYQDMITRQHELEVLSYRDKLTDIGNRRALERFMAENRNQIGVMYVDLNGLKETNDTLGHEFGDHLIRSCSDLLTHHFRKSECYRIGGDEFITATENISKDIFMKKITYFKEDAEVHKINLSIGFEWSDGNDISALIGKAEKRMRNAKEKYYETHQRYR